MPKQANKPNKKSGGKKTTGSNRRPVKRLGRRRNLEVKSLIYRSYKPSRKPGQGGVLRKTKALGRLIRWPKYVKLQRQRKVLLQRLKVPPSVNLFNHTASKKLTKEFMEVFGKYRPETKSQKKDRLRKLADQQAKGEALPLDKPVLVKYGLNHVTHLIERGQAKLVLIASDVDPVELVLWMPALCVKKDIPFAIVKNKARLGKLVNKKTAAVVALCDVAGKDSEKFNELCGRSKGRFNYRLNSLKRKWGNRTLGIKTRHKIEKRRRARKEEAAKRKAAREQQHTAAE